MKEEKDPRPEQILFWLVLTPSRSFWEISLRVMAVLMAFISGIMLLASILEQVEIYLR